MEPARLSPPAGARRSGAAPGRPTCAARRYPWSSRRWPRGSRTSCRTTCWATPPPFFAPVAAWICLGFTYNRVPRKVLEIGAGAAIGVGLGEVILGTLGAGGWQLAIGLLVGALVALAARSRRPVHHSDRRQRHGGDRHGRHGQPDDRRRAVPLDRCAGRRRGGVRAGGRAARRRAQPAASLREQHVGRARHGVQHACRGGYGWATASGCATRTPSCGAPSRRRRRSGSRRPRSSRSIPPCGGIVHRSTSWAANSKLSN